MFERDTLLKDLRENVCEIFVTQNGQQRAMRCSLKADVLPDSYHQSEASKVKEFHEQNPDLLAVWDMNNNAWRKLHINTVEYVQVVDSF